ADKIYGKNLTKNKNHLQFWLDYIKLKIALKDFNNAKELLNTVFNDHITDIFSADSFYEFKFMDAVLSLLERNVNSFNDKANQIVRDDFISDFDNDLLKLIKDIGIIGNDEVFLSEYLEILTYKMDPKAKTEKIVLDFENENDAGKKILMIETKYYYLASKNENSQIVELFNRIITLNLLDNNLSKIFINFSKPVKMTEEIKSVLLLILKSSISEEIKAEVREIIREKQIS
ncbi:MAG: hypothetical protein L6407_07395, partial [Candidatus Delongbacteria bacterium]|nr:hypothetical protein [Candidatus Delongbacteria bacterium]